MVTWIGGPSSSTAVIVSPPGWPLLASRRSATACSANSRARSSLPPAWRTACTRTSFIATTWRASAGNDRFRRKPTLLTLHRQPAEHPHRTPLVGLNLRSQRVHDVGAPVVAHPQREANPHRAAV